MRRLLCSRKSTYLRISQGSSRRSTGTVRRRVNRVLDNQVTEEILPGGEIHEGEGGVNNIFRKIGGYSNEKRIVHGGMIRNEEHPFPRRGILFRPRTLVKLK